MSCLTYIVSSVKQHLLIQATILQIMNLAAGEIPGGQAGDCGANVITSIRCSFH